MGVILVKAFITDPDLNGIFEVIEFAVDGIFNCLINGDIQACRELIVLCFQGGDFLCHPL